jgi:hypothetical protein
VLQTQRPTILNISLTEIAKNESLERIELYEGLANLSSDEENLDDDDDDDALRDEIRKARRVYQRNRYPCLLESLTRRINLPVNDEHDDIHYMYVFNTIFTMLIYILLLDSDFTLSFTIHKNPKRLHSF